MIKTYIFECTCGDFHTLQWESLAGIDGDWTCYCPVYDEFYQMETPKDERPPQSRLLIDVVERNNQ